MVSIFSLKKKPLAQVFTLVLRYLLGAAFVFSSLVKIRGLRFTTESGESYPIHTWLHYFETIYQSRMHWQAIGWAQLIAGFLLLTQRFATLGSVLFYPIILNIFLVTVSYNFKGTIVITGLMLLSNIYLLLWDWNKLKIFFNMLPSDEKLPFMDSNSWVYLEWAYFFISIVMEWVSKVKGQYLAEMYIMNPFLLLLFLFSLAVVSRIIVLRKEYAKLEPHI
jgi:uncharacterized membrane protein YphA (DoxX/SURF4 family)